MTKSVHGNTNQSSNQIENGETKEEKLRKRREQLLAWRQKKQQEKEEEVERTPSSATPPVSTNTAVTTPPPSSAKESVDEKKRIRQQRIEEWKRARAQQEPSKKSAEVKPESTKTAIMLKKQKIKKSATTLKRPRVSLQEDDEDKILGKPMFKKPSFEQDHLEEENAKEQVPEVDEVDLYFASLSEAANEENTKIHPVHSDIDEEVGDNDEELDEESLKQQKLLDSLTKLQTKGKELKPIDHSLQKYRPFRKDFYQQPYELQILTPEQISEIRKQLGNVRVKGANTLNYAPISKWSHLGLPSNLSSVITTKLKFDTPSAIQCQALPIIMAGRDVIGVAKTGSGKTLSYVLPMIRHVQDQPSIRDGEGPIGVVLAPTRELALQIQREINHFTSKSIRVYQKTLVFVEKQNDADELVTKLLAFKLPCVAIHGGKDQLDRRYAIKEFSNINSGVDILIATSVAARGLDVKSLGLVINFDPPNHMEDYVHRVGRTGRAGSSGTAITFVWNKQEHEIGNLVRALKLSKVEEIDPRLIEIHDQFFGKVKEGKEKVHYGFGGKGLDKLKQVRDSKLQLEKSMYDEQITTDTKKENSRSSTPTAAATSANISSMLPDFEIIEGNSPETSGPDKCKFYSRIIINDLPQSARWNIVNREHLSKIIETSKTSITTRGQFYPPGKSPPNDNKDSLAKLYLLVEGLTKSSVHEANNLIRERMIEGLELAVHQETNVPGGSYKDYNYKFFSVSEIQPGFIHVQYTNPKTLNAYAEQNWRDYGEIFTKLDADADVKLIVFSSGVDRSFSSGLNLKQAMSTFAPGRTVQETEQFLHTHIKEFQDAIGKPNRINTPTIGILNGINYGLALDISSAFTIRIAVSNARFSIAEVNIGIAADIGTLQRLPHLVNNKSKLFQHALLGDVWDAKEALELGYVSYVVDSIDAGLEITKKWGEKICDSEKWAIRGTKQHIQDILNGTTLDQGLKDIQKYNAYNIARSGMNTKL
ncbi:Pre-mRNA-processing ATP-dependent RNA helicase PRP5 [Spathaspora sp. JA1]|nr:Pre-mRNA-processing ATP-dependent RNA helicase PRP5 [Spathaspora sp. JA1]